MTPKRLNKNDRVIKNSDVHKNRSEGHRSFSQKFWMYIGYISGVLAIVVFSFQIGHHFGFQNAKKQEFKHFSEYLNQIKDGINLVNVSCNPKELRPGETFEIKLTIDNKSPYECDLWIGASATDTQGKEIWNRNQDRMVTITSNGITSVKRYLTFPPDVIEGDYDIQVNIWYGKKGDPSQSELISSAALRGQISIIPPKST